MPVRRKRTELCLFRVSRFLWSLTYAAAEILGEADRGENLGGVRPCLADIRVRGVADDLPDAFSLMLAMEVEALAALGHGPLTKADIYSLSKRGGE